jgi:hypothetical protein
MLARIRKTLPESWDPRRSGPEANARRLAEIRDVLYPQAKIRARMVDLVEEHGALRMNQIRDLLGMPLARGSMSGHLAALVGQKRLERAETGVYIIPGKRPDVLPPRRVSPRRKATG